MKEMKCIEPYNDIENYLQKNCGHGNNGFYFWHDEDNPFFIVCDLGCKGCTPKEFRQKCKEEKEKTGEIPHSLIVISHLHSDHLFMLNNMLKMHEKNICKIDKVIIPEPLSRCAQIVDLLKASDKEIKIESLFDNKETAKDVLALLLAYRGDDKKVDQKIDSIVEKYAKSIGSTKDDFLKELNDGTREIISEFKRIHEEKNEGKIKNKTISDKASKKELKKTIDLIIKIQEKDIKVTYKKDYDIENYHGVNICTFKPSKEKVRTGIDELVKNGKLNKWTGINVLKKYIDNGNVPLKELALSDIDDDNPTLLYDGNPCFNVDKIENLLNQVDKYDRFFFLQGLYTINYIENHCKEKNFYKLFTKELTNEYGLIGKVAEALVRKACETYELNQSNVMTIIQGKNHSFLQNGDREYVQELLFLKELEENPNIPIYIIATTPHHGSTTSFNLLLAHEENRRTKEKYEQDLFYITNNNEEDRENYSEFGRLIRLVVPFTETNFLTREGLSEPYFEILKENNYKINIPEALFCRETPEQEKEYKQFEMFKNDGLDKNIILKYLSIDEKQYQMLEEKYNKNIKNEKFEAKTYNQKLSEEREKIKSLEENKQEIAYKQNNDRGRI